MSLLKTRIPLIPIWPEVVELDGIKVPVRSSPLDPKSRRRLMRGSYEPAERDLAGAFIKPGDQILELGASIGVVTCFLSRHAGSSGAIIAVEANRDLKRAFDHQLRLNQVSARWINALCCPIWRAQVPAEVAAQTFQPSERSFSGRASNSAPRDDNAPPWMTAQGICEQMKFAPTAAVIDVEGAEAVWAEHSPNFPNSLRTAIVEFHPRLIGSRAAGNAVQAILNEGFKIAGLRESVIAFQRK